MRGRSHKALVAAAILAALAAVGMPAQGEDASPFDALLHLGTPNYTGGLTREDRAVAERIHAVMAARYTKVCPPRRLGQSMADPPDEPDARQPLPTVNDPQLAALIAALDNPSREVRDVAAYTIGLLGPSAKAAIPILNARQRQTHLANGWSETMERQVGCTDGMLGDFRYVIPDALVPAAAGDGISPSPEFIEAGFLVLAKLYLDEGVEYPPGILGESATRYSLRDRGSLAPVALFVQILEDERLSPQKRRDAAQALAATNLAYLAPARPALAQAALHSPDAKTRQYAAWPLAEWGDAAAIPALAEQAGDPENPTWSRHLCNFGRAASGVEDKIIAVALHAPWDSTRGLAVKTLGCIGTAKAARALLPMLRVSNWPLNATAAEALGTIGVADPRAMAMLRGLAKDHWSGIVRTAAADAVERLTPGYMPKPPATRPGIETLFLGGIMGPFDHGLPYCDLGGRFSLRGKTWFKAKWQGTGWQKTPKGFRGKQFVQGAGRQSFLRVADGWLMGSDGFESEGVLVHVSDKGVVTDLDRGASIEGIVRTGDGIFAYGYNLLRAGWPGALKKITRTRNGHWQAHDVVVLPSVAFGHAVAPGGELLLTDTANTYAVTGDKIVPLKCEKTHKRGFRYGPMSDDSYWRY